MTNSYIHNLTYQCKEIIPFSTQLSQNFYENKVMEIN